jgi:hypothetical protein
MSTEAIAITSHLEDMPLQIRPNWEPKVSGVPQAAAKQTIRAIIDHLELGLARAELPGATFNVVVTPDAGPRTKASFPTGEALAEYLRGFEGQEVEVDCYYGRPLGITRRPRYLVTHEGRYPLFAPDEGDEIDESGSLSRTSSARPLHAASAPPGSPGDPDRDDRSGDDVPEDEIDEDDDPEDDDDLDDDDEDLDDPGDG